MVIEKGNWQYSGNIITFDSCIKLIAEKAFSPLKAVNNYIDPLISIKCKC